MIDSYNSVASSICLDNQITMIFPVGLFLLLKQPVDAALVNTLCGQLVKLVFLHQSFLWHGMQTAC